MNCVIDDGSFDDHDAFLAEHYESPVMRDKEEAGKAYKAFKAARKRHEELLIRELDQDNYKQFRFTEAQYSRFKKLYTQKLNKNRDALRKKLFESQNGSCAYCCVEMDWDFDPRNPTSASVDHLAPPLRKTPNKKREKPKTRRNWLIAAYLHEKGFPEAMNELVKFMNRDANVVACCIECNRAKTDFHTPEAFYHLDGAEHQYNTTEKRRRNLEMREEFRCLGEHTKQQELLSMQGLQTFFDFG